MIAALIQNTAGLSIEIGGCRCFLIIPVSIILSLGESEGTAAFYGLLGGMLWDLSAVSHICFNAVFLCIVCFFCSALISNLLRDTFITNMLLTAVPIHLYVFFYWLFFIIINGHTGAAGTLFTFYLPSALYTIIVSILVWLVAVPYKRALSKPKKQN